MRPTRQLVLAIPLLLAACAAPSASWREGAETPATPQRPTFSTNTATASEGTIELEFGLQRDPGDSFDTPTALRYGLTPRDELFAAFSPFKMVELPGDDGAGFGDLLLGWRRRFHEEEESGASLAWQASFKLPTADEDDGLGSGELDGFLAGILSVTRERWSATGFAQFGLLGDPVGSGVDHQEALAGALELALQSNSSVFGELAGVFTPERDDEQVFTTLGAAWRPTPGLVLDTGIVVGLSSDAPDFQWLIGFTRNLGRASGYAVRAY